MGLTIAKSIVELHSGEKLALKVRSYFVEETQDPIMLLMGRLTEEEQPKLSNVMKRINTRLKYIEDIEELSLDKERLRYSRPLTAHCRVISSEIFNKEATTNR